MICYVRSFRALVIVPFPPTTAAAHRTPLVPHERILTLALALQSFLLLLLLHRRDRLPRRLRNWRFWHAAAITSNLSGASLESHFQEWIAMAVGIDSGRQDSPAPGRPFRRLLAGEIRRGEALCPLIEHRLIPWRNRTTNERSLRNANERSL